MYDDLVPFTIEELCQPLSPARKKIIERHSGYAKVYWCSSPVVAYAAAQQFKNDPYAKVLSYVHVTGYNTYNTPPQQGSTVSMDLSAAYDGIRQCAEPIITDEVHELWARATGIRGKAKRHDVGHRLFTWAMVDGLAHGVQISEVERHLFISEPPRVIRAEWTEEPRVQRRLHREDGPALVWGDFAMWFIHGVRVDEQIVLRPETQTVNQILREEKNEEVRRVRMERYGMLRLMEHSTTLDKRDNDTECTKEVLVSLMSMVFLVCHCPSTGRVYTLQVPSDVKTCEEAQRWLWGGSELLQTRWIRVLRRERMKLVPQMGYEEIKQETQHDDVEIKPMRLNIIGRS